MHGERRLRRIEVDRSEGFGERLLGALLDRTHLISPESIAPLIAEEVTRIGGRDVAILLQDYSQQMLVPLRGARLAAGEPEVIGDSPAGEAFTRAAMIEKVRADGVRVYLPLMDGSDEIGVMATTLDSINDDDRRLLRRLASLTADIIVTKSAYTDWFFQARRRRPMTMAAEIQWSLLPPMSMATPQVSVAGVLEPAYDTAGDSFDYALNDNTLHAAILDAMGHGLDAAVMATVAVGVYRHARRNHVALDDLYAYMDKAVTQQFGPDHFVTAAMLQLDINTGLLRWFNAGHPEPLLIRDGSVIERLQSPGTVPIGIGGAAPQVSDLRLHPGDRVLFFTDGHIEDRESVTAWSGEERLITFAEAVSASAEGVQEMVRSLSLALLRARGRSTMDAATLFAVEWRGDATAANDVNAVNDVNAS